MKQMNDIITEINLNYNDLGEDLILLESVLQVLQDENDYPRELALSSLERMMECIRQHSGDIRQLSGYLVSETATVS